MQDVSALAALFGPRSVAVVGASSDPAKPGHTTLKHMISLGYRGRIFPVNPREEQILGLTCYRSVLDIPEPVEACVLLVSADMTLRVAHELSERKKTHNDVAVAVCMSAGFGELNNAEGRQREADLVNTLRAASIRLIGPNCLGVMDTVSGFNTNFDIGTYRSGGISVLTQSGAFGNSFLFRAGYEGHVGLNKFVSIGNMADVQMHEVLQFWKTDDSTRVVGIYLEGLADPRRFFEAAREVSAVKPVVIFKSGRSELGSTAALSHTGAVAGADAIYDGGFRQADMIRAASVAEFYDTLRAFSRQPEPAGNRVCVLTHMGGPGTICMDAISAAPELRLAQFSPATADAIRAIVSPAANVGSPPGYIDLTAATTERLHNEVLQLLFADANVDMVIQILAPSAFLDQKLLAGEVAAAFESQAGEPKPLLNVVTFGGFADELRRGLEEAGLPTFDFSDSVARVAGNMARHGAIRSAAAVHKRAAPAPAKPDGPAARLIASALQQGRASLLEPEAYEVCRQYGIEVPPFMMADSLDAAVGAAREVGYPLVLKIVSADILHKSDIGGVMLGIDSDGALEAAYRRLIENVGRAAPHIGRPDVLVQGMMPPATELVLGGLRDPLFGPTVMAGMGGIYVEVLKRVGFRLAPLGVEEAEALIRDTLPPALVAGARGRDPMNVGSIARAVVALGRLFADYPQIAQVDLNPFLPYRERSVAVDARFILAAG